MFLQTFQSKFEEDKKFIDGIKRQIQDIDEQNL